MEKVREKEVKDGYVEKLVKLNRVAKVVKGGRRFSFSALVVVGYGDGRVGYGFGKANDVTDAIRKATDKAKTSIITVPLKGNTVPHDIIGNFKSASILMKPAVPGTGVIAGGAVRAVLELAGIENILAKSLGSKSPLNAANATLNALKALRSFNDVAKSRGISLNKMLTK